MKVVVLDKSLVRGHTGKEEVMIWQSGYRLLFGGGVR